MKKNVLYVGGFNLPDKNAAAQRVMTNGLLFKKSGYNIYYIDVKTNKVISDKFLEKEFEGFKYFVKSQQYPKSKKEWFTYITDISFIKKTIKFDLNQSPDIIVVYNYPAISLLRLISYCKKKKIKLIADVTEWYFPQGNFFLRIIKNLDSLFRMNILHKKLDGLIVISRFLEKKYKDCKIICLPPLVNKKSDKWKKIDNLKSEFYKLIYVGSISHGHKDRLDLIINSLSRIKNSVKNFRFTIIGVTKKEYLDFFGSESLPSDVDDFVSFLGRKPHNEVIVKIKESDYSIFFRENNLLNTAGFPTKFVESLACGTPVITNSSSDISEYFINEQTGYLLSTIIEKELDENLCKILNMSKNKIYEMKNNSSDYNKFHYEEYLNEFNNFLISI